MHIPDAYLSPATEGAAYLVMIPIWAIAARKTAGSLSTRQIPLLSVGSAFCFALQMFNIPAVGGTSAHALGTALLTILVGPWAAILGITLTLAIQALLFGDGGILSLAANSFDMAAVAATVAWLSQRLFNGRATPGSARHLAAAAASAYIATVTASISAAFLLGIQPMVAHDVAGHAQYCPFGFAVTFPAMVLTHLLVAGPAEAIVTVAALAYLSRSFPELLSSRNEPVFATMPRLAKRIGWVLVATPIGLIASGTAFAEWDPGEIRSMLGYVPSGMKNAAALWRPLLPDYGFVGLHGKPWEIVGYLVSAILGASAVALFTRSVVRRPAVIFKPAAGTGTLGSELPGWMRHPNHGLPPQNSLRSPWFERAALKMRETLAETVASETVARQKGFLQSVHPTAKLVGFGAALVATGLAASPAPLVALFLIGLAAAVSSHVPMKRLLLTVGGSVAFFGVIVAVPLLLDAVTPGPVVLRIASLAVTSPGIRAAATILLRLAAGISLSLVWNLTTPWHRLLGSLASIGVPRTVLATATLAYRYLFVTVETLGDMVDARTARQVGACSASDARRYAGAGAAVLFAKSLALTEEVHQAMQSRGFDGRFGSARGRTWRLADSATALAGASMLAIVILKGVYHAL